jgi:hypothetical protein
MAPVMDLSSSSNEEGLIADVSQDEEFARRLLGNLNCDALGPPGDGNIIILSDFDEEEEKVREEKTAGTEDVATSTAVNPGSTASADANDAPTGVKMIIVMIAPPIKRLTTTAVVEKTLDCLRLPCQELQRFCIAILSSLLCKEVGLIMQNN